MFETEFQDNISQIATLDGLGDHIPGRKLAPDSIHFGVKIFDDCAVSGFSVVENFHKRRCPLGFELPNGHRRNSAECEKLRGTAKLLPYLDLILIIAVVSKQPG